jgi:ubiquinone/menaquinone biosynthesis C-methylase UbiE
MFDKTARFYDAFYDAAGKDYRIEAEAVLAIVGERNPSAATLLDVACGTGRHLEVFCEHLRCVGVDLDDDLLAVAAARCPDVRFEEADMTQLSLGESFDVVTCLFSSVAYAATVDRLRAAIASMADHLNTGGVLVVEPFVQPDGWQEGHVGALFVDEPGLKAARLDTSQRDGNRVTLFFHYLIGTDGAVEYLCEEHDLGLFSFEDYVSAFEDVGLSVEVDEEGLIGRGLIVGVRETG